MERTEARLIERAKGANGKVRPLAGEIASGSYHAFDAAMASPLQPILLPPYTPGKVIAAGEPAFIVAFTWINPTVDVPDGFAVPASVQLSGRQWRLTLDLLNVTTGATQRLVQTGIVQITGGLSFHLFALPHSGPGTGSSGDGGKYYLRHRGSRPALCGICHHLSPGRKTWPERSALSSTGRPGPSYGELLCVKSWSGSGVFGCPGQRAARRRAARVLRLPRNASSGLS